MRRLLAALFLTSLALLAQSGHSVTLTWLAPTDVQPASAYNIYRGDGGCTGTPAYKKINTAPIAALTYVDTVVVAGATYCYVATHTLNGGESAYSNTAQAIIPVSAPRSLTISIGD